MNYAISRTSEWKGGKPCDEAYSQSYTVSYKDGNVRERIKWFVDLDTPEEFFNFVKKYEPLVIELDDIYPDGVGKDEPQSTSGFELEIYDDYRE